MDRLKKLKEKKGMSMHKMHPLEKKAKMGVIDELSKMAEDAMGSKLKGMNKVTVASDSHQGLEHGLEDAHHLLGKLPEAYDDSHNDHENFSHTERSEDGQDGDSDYPDADSDHAMESDPMAAHMHDEKEEGHGKMFAEGGEVESEDEDAADEGDMPEYDHMDDGELDEHLKALTAALERKGMR